LTVWAARQSMLGEGMSRNQQDLEIARQAAESALRDGERDLGGVIPLTGTTPACAMRTILPGKFTASCLTGLCIRDDASYASNVWATASNSMNAEPWWPKGRGGQWNTPVDSITNCTGFTGAVPIGTFTGAPAILGVARQPQYLIEYFKRSVPGRQEMSAYRITARGFGYSSRTQVVVQSIFLPD
jgi:type IV pilus assembly protein PilX